jgi:hypothetical protein
MENLLDLLAVVEQRLAKLNYGAANIAASYNGVSPSFSWSLLGWDVKRSGPAPLEWVPAPHPIFEDIHVERSKGLERMRELDVEANPPGRLPGTSTVEGLGWERFETAASGRRVTVFYSQGVLPPVTGPELVRRLQLVKRPLEPENVLQESEALKELIGQGSAALFDWENPYNSQAGDLLRVVNRRIYSRISHSQIRFTSSLSVRHQMAWAFACSFSKFCWAMNCTFASRYATMLPPSQVLPSRSTRLWSLHSDG